MDVPKFLDLAVELETELSKLYELVADRSGDPPIAVRLKAIANEELNHANSLRRGKRYYEEYPDLFSRVTMDENEASAGIEEVNLFRESLSGTNLPLVDRLKKLLELEKRFERVHFGASVRISDLTLKRLFQSLNKGDQTHIAILKGLIESFG